MQVDIWDSSLLYATAETLALEPLADARRSRLRQRVLTNAAPRPSGAILCEEGEWQSALPGVSVKLLRTDANTQSALWRLSPGARIPAHAHAHEEECLVVAGTLEYAGRRFIAGDYLIAQAGQAQQEISALSGATLWIRGERRF